LLRAEPSFMLFAVTTAGRSLKWATGEIRNNQEVCMAAVKQDGLALEFCAVELQEKFEVVLPATVQNGAALEFATEVQARRGCRRYDAL